MGPGGAGGGNPYGGGQGGGFNTGDAGNYSGYGQQGVGNGGWPTNGVQGQGAGAGGYNPGLMPGMGDNTQFQGGTPFWQPWPGWDMKTGTSPTAQGNMDQGAAQAPGAPDWLQHQLGDYRNLPMYTNPNQYGRWNWGTNLQGGGIPSPFGQYAQQTAQYNPLQFPPPPGGPGGQPPPPGGQPPPPGGNPPPPPGGGGGFGMGAGPAQWDNMSKGDLSNMLRYAPTTDYQTKLRGYLNNKWGDQMGQNINSTIGINGNATTPNSQLMDAWGVYNNKMQNGMQSQLNDPYWSGQNGMIAKLKAGGLI